MAGGLRAAGGDAHRSERHLVSAELWLLTALGYLGSGLVLGWFARWAYDTAYILTQTAKPWEEATARKDGGAVVTRVSPAAVLDDREIRPLLTMAIHTADRAATDGRCAICVEQRAVVGTNDPVCRSTACSERFYALPLEQRNRLRRSAMLAGWTAP